MKEIIIGGKAYPVKVTWGILQKVGKIELKFKNKIAKSIKSRLPDFSDEELIEEINMQSGVPVSLIMIWGFLKKRWYGLKPFMTKKRMMNNIEVKEIKKAFTEIMEWTSWEDREGKNLH